MGRLKMKRIIIIMSVVVCIFGCSKKEVLVDKPNGETITTETKQETVKIVETTVPLTNIDSLSLEEQEELFEKYLGLLGGDEPIMYNEQLNSVKNRGSYTKFNWGKDGDFSSEEVQITYEEYLPKMLKEIQENHPDIEIMSNEDYRFIHDFLNLGDFGTAEVAFLGCDNGIWENRLTGAFDNDEEKKSAFVKFSNMDNLREQGEYLKSLRKELDSKIENNKEIVNQFINDMMELIYGEDADNHEVKNLGITKIIDRDVRFYYVLGDKINSDIEEYYYIEDSVKGYIENGKFVRDLNPVWTDDDWGVDPSSVKDGFLLQGSKDGYESGLSPFKDEDIASFYNDTMEDSLKKRPYVASKKTSYILDKKSLFPNMNIEELKKNITSELPICRRVVHWGK